MKPLDSFDFSTNFEAKFFAVDIDVKGEDEQRYTELAHGWEGMLQTVSSAMHRYRFGGNGPFGLVENEMLGHLSDVRSWAWSTTTDASPTKAVIERGPVTITVMRLFANDLERVLFREMYPYGMRPGESELFDDIASPSRRDITVPRLDQTGASSRMIERGTLG